MGMTIESQYEIYPCPFCGYRGLLYRIGSGYVIRCENRACQAEQNVYSTEEAAVHKWNKRICFEPKMESEDEDETNN